MRSIPFLIPCKKITAPLQDKSKIGVRKYIVRKWLTDKWGTVNDCENEFWKTNTIFSCVIYDLNAAYFYLHLTRALINFNKICARWYNTTNKNTLYSLFHQSVPMHFNKNSATQPNLALQTICLFFCIQFPLTQNTNKLTVKRNK